jgi:hypothetical protein
VPRVYIGQERRFKSASFGLGQQRCRFVFLAFALSSLNPSTAARQISGLPMRTALSVPTFSRSSASSVSRSSSSHITCRRPFQFSGVDARELGPRARVANRSDERVAARVTTDHCSSGRFMRWTRSRKWSVARSRLVIGAILK